MVRGRGWLSAAWMSLWGRGESGADSDGTGAMAESRTWVEKVTVPRLGVSVAHLRSLDVDPAMTIYEFCAEFVKPATEAVKASYADFLLSDASTSHHVKPKADVFVSYAWSYTWGDVMGALEANGFGDEFVWLDVVVVNQHHALGKELDDWLLTFKTGVEDIGHVVVILAPWDSPVYVARAWCVFETLAAIDAKVKRDVVFPPSQKDAFVEAMRQGLGHADFMDTFGDVDVGKCKAANEADRVAILDLIGRRTDVNDALMGPIKEFYRKAALQAVAEMRGTSTGDAWAFNATGALHQALGDPDTALPWFKKALEAHRHPGSGSKEEDVATALNDIASCLYAQGKYDEALEYHYEALATHKRALGDDHPHVAKSLNKIAGCLRDQGRYDEALKYNYEALAMRKRALGDEHRDVAESLNNTALCLVFKHDDDEALKYHYEALAIWKRALGDGHPDVAVSLSNIATCLMYQGKYDEALKINYEALTIRKRALGDGHPSVADDLSNIAWCLSYLGRKGEARKAGRQALAIYKRSLGPDHPSTKALRKWWS